MATVEDKVRSSSVSVVCIVRLRIVFSKAALQERGSVEPSLDLPLVRRREREDYNPHFNMEDEESTSPKSNKMKLIKKSATVNSNSTR